MKITALAGGVGGAKLANGLSKILDPGNLSIIVNTGDDFFHHGLFICPDIDTIIYNLAGINDPLQGWGRKDDSRIVLNEMEVIGAEPWFNLGDRDLATHILRTEMLNKHISLTEVTRFLCGKRGISTKVLPMTDSVVSTELDTEEYGVLPFQEYFVKYHFLPVIKSIQFSGIDDCMMTNDVVTELKDCDLVVICPSNPLVSIAPILSIPGLINLLKKKPVIGVCPLINGKAIKGPLTKMLLELEIQPGSTSIAKLYLDFLDGFVIDTLDLAEKDEIERWGIISLATDTLMTNLDDQVRLAEQVIRFGKSVIEEKKA